MNSQTAKANLDPLPATSLVIPDHWTPEQAEFLLTVLDELNIAIWDNYGWVLRQMWEDRRVLWREKPDQKETEEEMDDSDNYHW